MKRKNEGALKGDIQESINDPESASKVRPHVPPEETPPVPGIGGCPSRYPINFNHYGDGCMYFGENGPLGDYKIIPRLLDQIAVKLAESPQKVLTLEEFEQITGRKVE